MTEPQSERLVECPFDVRVNDATYDRFYDVRDALAVARTLKRENPSAVVIVSDA